MQDERSRQRSAIGGFTLIELMIVVVCVAILATLAYPSYTQYLLRSRAVAGTDALSALAVRLEQRYQDVGGYGTGELGHTDGPCVITATAAHFAITCESSAGGQRFVATATGQGAAAGITYTIDETGLRKTVAHPRGLPPTDCWSLRGGACDS